MNAAVTILICLVLSLGVVGCGNKGPLYLPDAKTSPQSEPDPVEKPKRSQR